MPFPRQTSHWKDNRLKIVAWWENLNSNATKPRPILVSFLRSLDTSMTLSKIGEFKSPIHIKPGLSPEERAQESVLLKEHWSLIQKGAERS